MTRFRLYAACALLSLVGTAAHAQAFPSQPITFVVPYAPGSSSDLIPRLVAPIVQQALGVTALVENMPGANGSLGAAKVANGRADGYTVLMAPTGVLAINQWLYPKLSYDPKDFVPVTNAASTPNLIVVHKDVPASNLAELIALAKSQPGKLTYASAGIGSTSHLCGEMLKEAAGIDIVHVPFRGPAPAKLGLLSGQVSMICDNFSNVISEVRNGQLKSIVLAAKTRHPQAPDIPSAADAGLPAVDAGVWYSFVVKKGTPRPAVERLATEINKALNTPAVKEKLEGLGLTIVADGPKAFGKFLEQETARWQKIVASSGAKAE